MQCNLASIAAERHRTPPPAMRRRGIHEKHPATITGAHLQAVPCRIAHKSDCIPSDDSQACFQRIGRLPQDKICAPIQLGDSNWEFRSPVNTIYVVMPRFLIQNDGAHRIVYGFPQKKRLFVVF